MTKKTRKRLIYLGVGVVLIGSFVAYRISQSTLVYETEPVEYGTVVEEVSVTGSIAPSSKIMLQPEVSGKIVKIEVTEGQEVKEGDVLIRLDSRDASARVASQAAAVASARARLHELEAGATAEELSVTQAALDTANSQYDAAVAAQVDAETALQNAHKNYDNIKAKTEALEASKTSALLNDYDSALTTAADAVNRLTSQLFTSSGQLSFICSDSQAESNAVASRLTAKTALTSLESAVAAAHANPSATGVRAQAAAVTAALVTVKQHVDADAAVLNYAPYIDATTLATYRLNVSTAQSALNTAMSSVTTDLNNLDLQIRLNAADLTTAEISESSAEAALTSAVSAVQNAQAAVSQAQANLDLKLAGARPEVVEAQRAQVQAASATLASLQADLAKRTITAPVDGLVTDIAYDPGETVQLSQTAITLQSRDRFEIQANISEVDIAKIQVGNPVRITLDAFGLDEEWTGKVIDIQPAEKVVEGVIFYETKIVFDEEDPRLRSGMTANLDIETARHDNVLRVPIRAVKTQNGNDAVEVLVDGKPVMKEFKAGLESLDYLEVLSGLNEGEPVVIEARKKSEIEKKK